MTYLVRERWLKPQTHEKNEKLEIWHSIQTCENRRQKKDFIYKLMNQKLEAQENIKIKTSKVQEAARSKERSLLSDEAEALIS